MNITIALGHKTEDRYDLRDAMEQLIQEGRLARYIASQRSPRKGRGSPMKDDERRNPRAYRNMDNIRDYQNQEEEPVMRMINVIVGGFASGGVTKSARKKYVEYFDNKDEEAPQATYYARNCIFKL